MANVNPESCAIDEYVYGPISRKPAELNITEALQASGASSESQTVRPPRFFRPPSYSGQFRTLY
jgi:hypothetical protein